MSEFEKKVDALADQIVKFMRADPCNDNVEAEACGAAKQALLDEYARVVEERDRALIDVRYESAYLALFANHQNVMKERDELKAAIRGQSHLVDWACECAWSQFSRFGHDCTPENCIWTRCQAEESK